MKCEKCLKRGREVFMKADIPNKRYFCPECDHIINWVTKKVEDE
ncbi:MAG: hypothetical protein QXX68_02855 [Candidatus Pacearchaeota archaeon]